MIELVEENMNNARIVVVGVGGGGGNAVSTMIRSQLAGVDFISANTDSQAIGGSLAPVKIQLGCSLAKGLGAGRVIGKHTLRMEVTLTDRTDMGVAMLLGRSSLGPDFLVHPTKTNILSPKKRKTP